MSTNRTLQGARREKNDEFYTRRSDIENEIKHYKKHFKGKVVYCNCDDPEVSCFYIYFKALFAELGLRKLIASCYKSDNPKLRSRHNSNHGYVIEYDGTGRKRPKKLKGDGDFRNLESIELLKQADIVVTNPPFSLFRTYVAQLVEHNKQFLIIGNLNAITYKEIFQLLKTNKIWLGNKPIGADMLFNVPKSFAAHLQKTKKEGSGYKIIEGEIKGRAPAIWFTNIDHKKRNVDLELYKEYKRNKKDYRVYDNYDAIEIGKVSDIPCDNKGLMGVPISFMDKYNPKQFELLGIDRVLTKEKTGKVSRFRMDGKELFARVIIRNKRIGV